MPAPLGNPPEPSGPLFVYGLLKPDELAYPAVQDFVARHESAAVPGTLRLRDGLPLFDPQGQGMVEGEVLWFREHETECWAAVSDLEPPAQYKWGMVEAHVGRNRLMTNVLVGRSIDVGTPVDPVQEWSASTDPVFVEGLNEVRELVIDAARHGVANQPDTAELWHQFFRLQAAYLLLWSIVERYTALRFGPALEPHRRVSDLGEDVSFRAAVVEAEAAPDHVVDSRDPKDKVHLRADGSGAARYYYQVRSNLSHRGKSAFRDSRLVYKAVTELHDTMRLLLAKQLPSTSGRIERLDRVEPEY